MKVTYAIGAQVGGLGIGTTSYQAVRGISRHDYLKNLVCLSYVGETLPEANIIQIPFARELQTHRWSSLNITPFTSYDISVAFDCFASRYVDGCDIFHGWGSMCLTSLRKAKENGAKTFIEGSSTHPKFRAEILDGGYKPDRLQDRVIQEIKEVDYITTPSQFAKDSYILYGFPEDKIFLVPYGADINRFKPNGKKDDVFRVLYAGQVMERKGVQYLLTAWGEMGLKNAELVIAGKVYPQMNYAIKQQALKQNLRVVGKVPDLLPYYQNSDILVCPSLEEGSALVTYEAMACRLPVITTPNSGSVVINGVEGFIIPPKNIEAIKEKIQYFYDNRKEIRRMGANARATIDHRYTWNNYGDNLCKVYEEVMK